MSTKNDPDDSPNFFRDYFADLANHGLGQHRITYDPANPEEKAEAERLIGQIHGLLRPTPTPGAIVVPTAEPLLSEVRVRFLAETKATKQPATVEKLEYSLDLFEKLVGDRPVSTYSQTDLGDFKGKLLRLPKNPSKDARIRHKSVQQLVARTWRPQASR